MFKTITSVLDPKKNPSNEDLQKISSYIFCKWLSGSPHAVGAANQINLYSDIPIENQYKMIKSAFAGKIKYIPYPKSITEDKLKKIKYIAEHFNINEDKANEYLEYMSVDEINKIITMYSDYELKKGNKCH